MKKIIIYLLVLLFPLSIYAKDNRLYFVEEDNSIKYDSKLYDENIFMKHTDMVPGSEYIDELVIENGTNKTYTLYLKLEPKTDTPISSQLLESIEMSIYLNDKDIYVGNAMGKVYTAYGINLQEAVLLDDFSPSETSKLVVKTKLNKNYSNGSNEELSQIDWVFYAQDGHEEQPQEIVKGANTMKNDIPIMIIIAIIVVLIGCFIIVYAKKKKQ